MENTDYFKTISRELIRTLRGPKSQSWLNTKLNSEYNLASRWETGQRRIYWNEFLVICECLNKDTTNLWTIIFGNKNNSKKEQSFFKVLVESIGVKEACKLLGQSPSSLYRWKGTDRVPLDVILHLLYINGCLHRFIQSLTDINLIPTFQKAQVLNQKVRSLFAKYPVASPLLLYLETSQYKNKKTHKEGDLAKRFGLKLLIEKK